MTKDQKELYEQWEALVNMDADDLDCFRKNKYGKKAGLSEEEADEQGIRSGRESAKWIVKMKNIPVEEWSDEMWEWAQAQVSFLNRMIGMLESMVKDRTKKGMSKEEAFEDALFDGDEPERILLSLLIWGHDPSGYDIDEFYDC